jgi:hypothetical protein
VGGLSSIVWGFLAIIFGSYEAFKYNASLIGLIYPTAPQPERSSNNRGANDGPDDDSDKPGSSGEAKRDLI